MLMIRAPCFSRKILNVLTKSQLSILKMFANGSLTHKIRMDFEKDKTKSTFLQESVESKA